MKHILILLLLIPNLSWGLTFKNGEQVDAKSSESSLSTKNINFASDFYTDEIQSCSVLNNWNLSSDLKMVQEITDLIGYDWQSDWKENSTCGNVVDAKITVPMTKLMSATHTALAEKDIKSIEISKNILIELAKTNTLYNTVSYNDIKNKKNQWSSADAKNCWYHVYERTAQFLTHYMITSIWIKEYIDDQEIKILNSYIDKMYKKFVDQEYKVNQFKKDRGIYSFANNGLTVLVYAQWTDNEKLALKEINTRFSEFDKLIYKDGYLNNNSFRGVRAQWYHSYGVNAVLGYVHITQTWGIETPKNLKQKLIKASEVINLAITDYDTFRSRKWNNPNKNMNENWTNDPSRARMHTHQDAVGIGYLMQTIAGVELLPDSRYLELQYHNNKDAMDNDIGFPPNCLRTFSKEMSLLEELDLAIQ